MKCIGWCPGRRQIILSINVLRGYWRFLGGGQRPVYLFTGGLGAFVELPRGDQPLNQLFCLRRRATGIERHIIGSNGRANAVDAISRTIIRKREGQRRRAQRRLFAVPRQLRHKLKGTRSDRFQHIRGQHRINDARTTSTKSNRTATLRFTHDRLAIAHFLEGDRRLTERLSSTFLISIFRCQGGRAIQNVRHRASISMFLRNRALAIFQRQAIRTERLLGDYDGNFRSRSG